MGTRRKIVLDPACGSRMMWFNKNDKRVLFTDIRKEKHILCDGRKLVIAPDLVADFRKLPFRKNRFKMVVFDPPHLIGAGKKGWMGKKYGSLSAETWQTDLSKGFSECWRVLEPGGILIFKWSQQHIKLRDILACFNEPPMFGHGTKGHHNSMWVCWMKI